jgi:hypothetical protein
MTSPRNDNFENDFDAIVMFTSADYNAVLFDSIMAGDYRAINYLLHNFRQDGNAFVRVSFPSEVAHDG